MFGPGSALEGVPDAFRRGFVTVLPGMFFDVATPACIAFGCDFGGGIVIMAFGVFTALFGGAFAIASLRIPMQRS